MNNFIKAIKILDFETVKELIRKEPDWLKWSEADGKNGLHYLCAINVSDNGQKIKASLHILKLFLKNGMNINSVHNIADGTCDFPATPFWYAYTRGRNEKLYSYLLKHAAIPNNCMFAITWNDDVEAAELFKKYGAVITQCLMAMHTSLNNFLSHLKMMLL